MTFASGTITGDFIGTVSGAWAGEITQGVGFFPPSGNGFAVPEQFQGTLTCVCTVAGVGSGTLAFAFRGGFEPSSGGQLTGTLTILQGTADLAGVQGQGTFAAGGFYTLNLIVAG